MKINLSKQQYKDLLESVAIAHTINELLSDAVESSEIDYDERSDRTRELQSYLLEFAGTFQLDDAFMVMEGETFLDEEYFDEQIQPIMEDYEEFVLHDALPNLLAWRDFNHDYTAEEQEKMAEENGEFFGAELYPYEERYWHEFAEHGFDRLFIRDDGKGKGTPSPYL